VCSLCALQLLPLFATQGPLGTRSLGVHIAFDTHRAISASPSFIPSGEVRISLSVIFSFVAAYSFSQFFAFAPGPSIVHNGTAALNSALAVDCWRLWRITISGNNSQ
jgi:hypothetical protein